MDKIISGSRPEDKPATATVIRVSELLFIQIRDVVGCYGEKKKPVIFPEGGLGYCSA